MINLERSPERRRFQERQLERIGIEHEFVPGVDGWALPPEQQVEGLRPGIVGCALGNIAAYQRIVDDGRDCGLVLEDDAILPDDIEPLLDAISRELEPRDAVLLHYRAQTVCPLTTDGAVQLDDKFRLLYPLSPDPLSATTAYVITAEACERLIEFLQPIRYWPDDWKVFIASGAIQRLRCVDPRPIDAEAGFRSTVGYGDGLLAALVPRWVRDQRRKWLQRRFSRFPIVDEPPRGPSVVV